MDSCKKMFWNVFFLDRNNSKDKKFFLKWHYKEILNDWIHDSLEILNFHRFLSLVILIKRSLMGKNNAVYVWYFHTKMRLLYVFLFLFFFFLSQCHDLPCYNCEALSKFAIGFYTVSFTKECIFLSEMWAMILPDMFKENVLQRRFYNQIKHLKWNFFRQ